MTQLELRMDLKQVERSSGIASRSYGKKRDHQGIVINVRSNVAIVKSVGAVSDRFQTQKSPP
jgi:hypothetical protein